MKTPAPFYEVAEVQLTYKNQPDIASRPKVMKSEDAYAIFIQTWDENKIGFVEQAKVLLLNRSNAVLGICELGTGGVSGVIVDPKLVFVAALKANASAIILAHNHPSGSVKPSCEDRSLTCKIEEVGKLLDISILDHLIITPSSFYSFTNDQVYYSKDMNLSL